jgi:hypothetical protein
MPSQASGSLADSPLSPLGSGGPATIAQGCHVIAEEAVIQLPERSPLADHLVGEATLFEGQENQEMSKYPGAVSRIKDVVDAEEGSQGPVAHEEPGREPGGGWRPVGQCLLEDAALKRPPAWHPGRRRLRRRAGHDHAVPARGSY